MDATKDTILKEYTNEYKSNYKKVYNKFYLSLEKCHSTSKKYEGIKSLTSQHYFSSLLFTKMCTIGYSISQLSPPPKYLGQHNIPWDYSSVASLTRNIIECYLTFYYLCINDCPSDEKDARLFLMHLHDHTSRTNMFRTIKIEEPSEIQDNIAETINLLKKNTFFIKFSEKEQKQFLKGKTSFFKQKVDIVKDCGKNVTEYMFLWKFLSSHTHSSPMGFYRISQDRGRGLETFAEVHYTTMCLSVVDDYLTKANKEFTVLFKKI